MKITQKQIATKWAESIIAEREYTNKCREIKTWSTKRAENIKCDKLRHEAMTMLRQYANDHGIKEWELRRKLHPKAESIIEQMA